MNLTYTIVFHCDYISRCLQLRIRLCFLRVLGLRVIILQSIHDRYSPIYIVFPIPKPDNTNQIDWHILHTVLVSVVLVMPSFRHRVVVMKCDRVWRRYCIEERSVRCDIWYIDRLLHDALDHGFLLV